MKHDTFVNRIAVKLNATRFVDPQSDFYILNLHRDIQVRLQFLESEPRQILVLIPLFPHRPSMNLNLTPLKLPCSYEYQFNFRKDDKQGDKEIVVITSLLPFNEDVVTDCLRYLQADAQGLIDAHRLKVI